MNSRQIECFLSVAENLSYTDAAKKLFISQSNVSRQILTLEEELGFDLFERGNNYVQLTPAGMIMVTAFKQVEDIFEEQKKLAEYTSLGKTGKLKIGFMSNMNIDSFCVKQMDEFIEKYPNIIMEFICFPDGDYEEALRTETIDVVFSHDFDAPESINIESINFCDTNMKILYSSRHPLAKKTNPTMSDVKEEAFWTVESSNTEKRKELVKKVMEFYDIKKLKTYTALNYQTILLNVNLGIGLTFVDDYTVRLPLEGYSVLELDPEVSRMGINISWSKKNLNPMIPLFVKTITSKMD